MRYEEQWQANPGRKKERERPHVTVVEDELGVTVVVESRWIVVVVEAGRV